jgi:dihydroorotase
MNKTLIKEANIVNEGKVIEGDVLIIGDRIECIDTGIKADGIKHVVEAKGKWLTPGFIDDQVHFREPGLTDKGTIATESMAAIAGGTTSVMDMPNTSPPSTSREAIKNKIQYAMGKTYANYSAYMGATNYNIEEIKALTKGEACGIKVFMGASTGNILVDDPVALELIFKYAQIQIVTHCEDSPTIDKNIAQYRKQFGSSILPECHVEIRSREACYKSSSYAVDLARRHGSKLHVLHLTTAEELDLFSIGEVNNKSITAEVCVHHLWFSRKDYGHLGNLIKCNPSVKEESDRLALLSALKNQRIDVIATDHAPHLLSEKEQNYFDAPSGLPLIQHAFQMVIELSRKGHFSIADAIKYACHNPSVLFGVKERGFIREGYFADLVLIDPNQKTSVNQDDLHYKCNWSPLEGHHFNQAILQTYLNGSLVFDHGKIIGGPSGRALSFVSNG